MGRHTKGIKAMEETTTIQETKFCKECGGKINKKAIICPLCGCQIEETKTEAAPQQIIINNSNQNQNTNTNFNATVPIGARLRHKWTAFFLCLFAGFFGAHKFYEGRIGSGLLYLCTFGLFFFGWFFDLISLLSKPDPYYVF